MINKSILLVFVALSLAGCGPSPKKQSNLELPLHVKFFKPKYICHTGRPYEFDEEAQMYRRVYFFKPGDMTCKNKK